MAIELYDGSNGDGLFNILGKFAYLLEVLNVARGTTVATEANDAILQYKKKTNTTLDFDRAMQQFGSAEQGWRQGGDGFASVIAQSCQRLLQEFVLADDANVPRNLIEQIKYVIAQMVDQGFYVNGNTLSVTPAYVGGGSIRALEFITSIKDSQSKVCQNALAEVIQAEVVSSDLYNATIRYSGERRHRSLLSEDYPAGSGISLTAAAITVDNSLLSNASFQAVDATTGKPTSWAITAGEANVLTGVSPVLTVTISGTPTAGQYWITLPSILSFSGDFFLPKTTDALAFNATGSQVQSAIRAIPGYELATVVTTGTGPDYTHTITCDGYSGESDAPVVVDTFDTGSGSGGITTAGSAYLNGRALWLSPGVGVTHAIEQRISLTADTAYVLAVRVFKDGAGGSGRLRLSLVADVDGSIVSDHEANQITVTKNVADLGDAEKDHFGLIFSVPATLPMPVAVKLESDSAPSLSILLDDIILAPATELYPGGPHVAAIVGTEDVPTTGTKYTLTVANNYNSEWQLRFNQLFNMSEKRLTLPTSGSTLLDDSLIG